RPRRPRRVPPAFSVQLARHHPDLHPFPTRRSSDLTHYQAAWTNLKDFEGQVNYPGQIVTNGTLPEEKRIYNLDTLEKMMRKPIHLADSLNLPLYCGEFGVINKSPVEAKLAWYRDMVAVFEKNNIAYANWNYKAGSFGIVDQNITPDQPMVDILVGNP